MFFIFIIWMIVAAFILLVLLLKINLIFKAEDKSARLYIKVLRIIIIRRKYELRREHGDIATIYCVDKPKDRRILSLLDIIKTYQQPDKPKSNEKARGQLFAYINSRSTYKLGFKISLGLGDAFATAMLCGFIQTVAGSLICLIKDHRHKIYVDIIPEFNMSAFSFSADCIITLSLANIIIGYMIYKINKRR